MAQTQEVTCSACSTTLRVPDKYWGKKVRCPQCKDVIAVPAGSAVPVAATKAPAPAPAATDDVDFLDDDAFVDEDPYADSPSAAGTAPPRVGKSSKTPKSSQPDPKAKAGAFGMEKKMVGSGVLGGIGLMVGAIVWFVLGLMADRIFFYPPIMFIIGLVAMIKGIIGSR
jgi:hypothetical protein